MPDGSKREAVTHVHDDRPRRQALTLRGVFGPSFWMMAGLAAAAGVACWTLKGQDAFRASFASDVDLLVYLAPRFAAGMLIAAFAQTLLRRDRVASYIGENAGVKAIGIATFAGALTPGGPMTSFPLVRALRDAGTGRGPLVAYVTAWSTMGFQRVLNWELPLLGPDFTLVRLVSSLPLPLIAGLLARLVRLPHGPGHEGAGAEPPHPETRDGR